MALLTEGDVLGNAIPRERVIADLTDRFPNLFGASAHNNTYKTRVVDSFDAVYTPIRVERPHPRIGVSVSDVQARTQLLSLRMFSLNGDDVDGGWALNATSTVDNMPGPSVIWESGKNKRNSSKFTFDWFMVGPRITVTDSGISVWNDLGQMAFGRDVRPERLAQVLSHSKAPVRQFSIDERTNILSMLIGFPRQNGRRAYVLQLPFVLRDVDTSMPSRQKSPA